MKIHEIQNILLPAMLSHVPFDGWSERAFERALSDTGLCRAQGLRAFPNGAGDVLDHFMAHLDQAMENAIYKLPLETMKLHEKVQASLLLRLKSAEPYREALRKAVAHYALPIHAHKGLKRLYATVDIVWRAVGDHPTDFSFYTKRASLAMIYASTLLFWLDDISPEQEETPFFLQRRLKDLLTFHRVKQRFSSPLNALVKRR